MLHVDGKNVRGIINKTYYQVMKYIYTYFFKHCNLHAQIWRNLLKYLVSLFYHIRQILSNICIQKVQNICKKILNREVTFYMNIVYSALQICYAYYTRKKMVIWYFLTRYYAVFPADFIYAVHFFWMHELFCNLKFKYSVKNMGFLIIYPDI